jgi:sec-independent protein translocase protein TatA
MFGMPGGMELVILLFIILIVFGAGKLPQVGRSLGTAITEFKEGIKGVSGNDNAEPPVKHDPEPAKKE